MTQADEKSRFEAKLLRPAKPDGETPWLFVILPREVSETLPRRGRTTVTGTINGQPFQETLEPDGHLSHWLRLSIELCKTAGAEVGGTVTLAIQPVEQEPEPQVPADFQQALQAQPEAHRTWTATTTIARLDWIHWITSAKQSKTRTKRISDACEKLAAGKKRVCCFDPSGFYSKALSAPAAVDSPR